MEYYSKKYIQFLLLESCKDRDFSALGQKNENIRGLSVKCLFDLNRALKLIGWEKHKQKLYIGCAKLKEIPKFTFSPKNRSSETSVWYRNEYSDYVTSYDLFFDFDKKPEDSWESLINEVKSLKEYLDDYKVPYYILFSGNKGFQIVVDGAYLPIDKIEKGNVYPHKKIVEDIKEKMGLTFLDLANNGVNSRLRKIPYSLVGENIALPLSDEQFNNFKIENMKAEFILDIKNRIPLVRRGNLERYPDLKLEEKRGNLANFIKLFAFK